LEIANHLKVAILPPLSSLHLPSPPIAPLPSRPIRLSSADPNYHLRPRAIKRRHHGGPTLLHAHHLRRPDARPPLRPLHVPALRACLRRRHGPPAAGLPLRARRHAHVHLR